MVLFSMDLDVLSVARRAAIGTHFVKFSLCQKDFDSRNPAAQTGNEKDYRSQHRKQLSQDINQKPESD